MKKTAILIYPEVALFELGCAVELFGIARPEFEDWYECDIVTLHHGPINSSTGLGLTAQTITTLAPYQRLVIPSWSPDPSEGQENLLSEIKLFHESDKQILSFCSGAFLLAEAGILDHRQATTHWRYADRFQQRFPTVNYQENVLYTLDELIGCSAGSAAAIDLGLAVIRADFGYTIANQVARRLVMSPHRKGGQAQFVDSPLPIRPDNLSETLDWVVQNLSKPMNVADMAARSHMSRRTFDRRFRASHGCSPKRWLISQRLNAAKGLLESTSHSIEHIAQQAGFESATALRHHFRNHLGLSPRQYRDQFASLTIN